MQPNGAGQGQWPWMLKTPDITLYLARGKWNGVGAVRLSSQYLWSCTGLLNALVWLDAFLTGIFRQAMHLQPSEIHHLRGCGWLVGYRFVGSAEEFHLALAQAGYSL